MAINDYVVHSKIEFIVNKMTFTTNFIGRWEILTLLTILWVFTSNQTFVLTAYRKIDYHKAMKLRKKCRKSSSVLAPCLRKTLSMWKGFQSYGFNGILSWMIMCRRSGKFRSRFTSFMLYIQSVYMNKVEEVISPFL